MAEQTENYQGKDIVTNDDEPVKLSIDGTDIGIWYDEDAKKYRSASAPYQEFDSIMDLGKKIVDNE